MTHIKICGITSVEDAALALEAGADAIGLNFYPPSPRYISVEKAAEIRATIPPAIPVSGVFVNVAPEEIFAISQRVGFDIAQLHGDESPPTSLACRVHCPHGRLSRSALTFLPTSWKNIRTPPAIFWKPHTWRPVSTAVLAGWQIGALPRKLGAATKLCWPAGSIPTTFFAPSSKFALMPWTSPPASK